MQAIGLKRALAAAGIAAAMATAVIVHGLWRAGQQLMQLPVLTAADRPAAAPRPASLEPPEGLDRSLAPTSMHPTQPSVVQSDPVRERFEAEAQQDTRPRTEAPDDRAALEALLGDPDPDVRDEAAALLRVLDAELLLSAGAD